MAAAPIAILYRYWLVAPVLKYLSIGQWRFLAIVVALACGGVLALLRFPVLALACGSMVGLLLGGTWAAWQAPHDVPVSISTAFVSHLESFWRTVIMLSVTATVSGFCCSRFARRRFDQS
jgi:hypothetical protein